MPEGEINGEKYVVPDGYIPVPAEAHQNATEARELLGELDRSQHGRHEGDAESQDPSGTSQGNPLLREGQHIGYHISGKRIVVPHWRDLQKPHTWYMP